MFSVAVATVVVKCLFSVMSYAKGKNRATHNDEGAAATVRLKNCQPVLKDGSRPLPATLLLNQDRFLSHDARDIGDEEVTSGGATQCHRVPSGEGKL